MLNKNVFLDAEEVLSGAETFWVAFTDEIDNVDRDEVQKKTGLYHWRTDIYIFVVEERVLAISFGHPNETQWHYTTDASLLAKYLAVLNHISGTLTVIEQQVKREAK